MSNAKSDAKRNGRSKVVKACDNCRRRKIKCSGTKPCASCQTYDCDCVFSNSSLPVSKPRKSRKLNSKVATKSSSITPSPISSTTTPTNIDYSRLSSIICATDHNVTLDAASIDINKAHRHLGEFSNIPVIPPIDGSVMKDDTSLQEQLQTLQSTIQTLYHTFDLPQTHDIIEDINKDLIQLLKEYKPQSDPELVKKYSESIKHSDPSIEVNFLKNRYSSKTKFSNLLEWNDLVGEEDRKQWVPDKVVDEIFGLYSPWLILTLKGIGNNMSKCMTQLQKWQALHNDPSQENTENGVGLQFGGLVTLKESIFLLLRFFDICMEIISKSIEHISSPLESGLKKQLLLKNENISISSANTFSNYFGVLDSSFTPEKQNSESNDTIISSSELKIQVKKNSKELLLSLINCLPQPFTYTITSISNDILLSAYDDDFQMFSIVLKMLVEITKRFESLMTRLTYRDAPPMSSDDMSTIANYCQTEEILYSLCANFYNSTLYHLDDHFNNIKYLELLFLFLKQQLINSEFYGFERVLDVAVKYAIQMGFSRWEYYVGLDEFQAEQRRRIWWKLFVIEIVHCIKKSYTSIIIISQMNCLLPSYFRNLGYLDQADFLQKIGDPTFDNFPPQFNDFNLEDLGYYGHLALCLVYSDFSSNVLYNDKFTSIKIGSLPSFLKLEMVNEIYSKTSDILNKINVIEKQVKSIFNSILRDPDHLTKNATTADEMDATAVQSFLHSEMVRIVIIDSVINLTQRFQISETKELINKNNMKYSKFCFDRWAALSPLIMALPSDLMVVKALFFYGHITIVVSNMFEEHGSIKHFDTLLDNIKVCKRLEALTLIFKNSKNNIIKSSKKFDDISRLFFISAILCHMSCLGFIFHRMIRRDDFLAMVKQAAPDIFDFTSHILNPKSYIFTKLIKPVEETGLVVSARKWFRESNLKKAFVDAKCPDSLFYDTPNMTPNGNPVCPYSPMTSKLFISQITSKPRQSSYDFNSSIGANSDVQSKKVAPNTSEFQNSTVFSSNIKSQSGSTGTSSGTPINNDKLPFLSQNTNSSASATTLLDDNLMDDLQLNNGYNLGTFDEFVNAGDLDTLLSLLLSDAKNKN